jgi:hypothetical protein
VAFVFYRDDVHLGAAQVRRSTRNERDVLGSWLAAGGIPFVPSWTTNPPAAGGFLEHLIFLADAAFMPSS